MSSHGISVFLICSYLLKIPSTTYRNIEHPLPLIREKQDFILVQAGATPNMASQKLNIDYLSS
uniref:Putative ovule protein n=1 Tax=Solanum chacoense TaxID=4108 RepID=A0A0V0GHW6_SOLCH